MQFKLNIIDWRAISAVSTFLAVLVAIFYPLIRDYYKNKREANALRRKALAYLLTLKLRLEPCISCEDDKSYKILANFFKDNNDAINGMESLFLISEKLTEEEQRLFCNLIIMLKDRAIAYLFGISKETATLLYQYINSLIDIFSTYNIYISHEK